MRRNERTKITSFLQTMTKLKSTLHSTLTHDEVKHIARAACAPSMGSMDVYDAPQPEWFLYNLPKTDDPCWFVAVSQAVPDALQSCTVVVISKTTGRVVYCGSAHDEG